MGHEPQSTAMRRSPAIALQLGPPGVPDYASRNIASTGGRQLAAPVKARRRTCPAALRARVRRVRIDRGPLGSYSFTVRLK